MEKEYGVSIVSLEMDRDAEASGESQSESTLSNSPESGLTGDADSKKLDEYGGWTNEKHSSYLEYLENSFVKQLYSLLGGEEEAQRLSGARGVRSNSHKLTHQFKVLQNGCRQKVNFGKKRAHLETSSEFHSQKQSHEHRNGKYTMGIAVQLKEEIENSGDKAFTGTPVRTSLGHEYPAQSTAEASGQNFGEVGGEKGCNSRVSTKRRREANYDDSSLNDQVVP